VVELTEQRIDVQKLMDLTSDEKTGAAVLFLGTTRRWTGTDETRSLFYEGYRQMALEHDNSGGSNRFGSSIAWARSRSVNRASRSWFAPPIEKLPSQPPNG
jgi:hypothetical protein